MTALGDLAAPSEFDNADTVMTQAIDVRDADEVEHRQGAREPDASARRCRTRG